MLSDAIEAITRGLRYLLQGDDYPLEYYPDGYPKLPVCLDRHVTPLAKAA